MMRARTPLVAAALLLSAAPVAAVEQAACGLYPATGLANWAKGEDSDFFTNQGGVPNIVFLLDNSGSINRMAPDGAVNTWGTQGASYGCQSPFADALRYFSPCGLTTQEGRPYDGTVDYATIANVCPYLDSGNQVRTGDPGFDPNYFCPGGGSSCNGHPNFFDKNYVFHDNDFSHNSYSNANCENVALTSTANSCRGFEENGVYPAATSVTAFCNAWAQPPGVVLTAADLTARRTSCNTCLGTKGYWFSGYYFKNDWNQTDPWGAWVNNSPVACGTTQDCVDRAQGVCVDRATLTTEYNGGDRFQGLCRFPHLYFTGNFLSFHPPKYLALRKVMKDVLMDTRRIRLGLVTFNGQYGGKLEKQLNPACNLVYPPSPSNFDANRSSVLSALAAVNFNNSTPLSEALLNVGEMYRTSGLPWFNTGYQQTAFENAAGTKNQASVCFSCQKSSVIVITDGLSNYDSNIPDSSFATSGMTLAVSKAPGSYAGMAGYNIKDISAADCPLCNTDAEAPDVMPDGLPLQRCNWGANPKKGACDTNAIPNYLPKVAWYLHHMDFRQDTESGADGGLMTGHQGLDIYTIGYGLGPNAQQILEHAAYRDPLSRDRDVGGGLSKSASNVAELKQAIMDMFEDVNQRATSFGSASVASLQTTASIGTIVPRFEPSKAALWSGHLYDFRLFSEFSAGCKVTLDGQPYDPNDKDCDRACDSIFYVDADDAFIAENDAGQFVKNSPSNVPLCGPKNHCGSCATVGTTPARPLWESGAKLAAAQWQFRNAYTAVDQNHDGVINIDDGVLRLRDDDATAAALLPYVQAGGKTCPTISMLLAQAGNIADSAAIDAELAATPTRKYTSCVRTMIRYLLGADIFDQNGNGNFRDDRPAKLGDIFHSSPTIAYPPFPKSSNVGGSYPNQTLPTLWEGKGGDEAYPAHVARYRQRDRLIIVGANDGFLHAFKAAEFRPGDDPATALRVEAGWFDDALGGDEEWAFMPPDLLPNLPLLLGNLHQFWVDGTPFVRDVWVDANQDDIKQEDEYHTIVVEGERRGGNHYFALDITHATRSTSANQDPDAKPTFLWVWPQPRGQESLSNGQSFQEAVPAPPTIGPVRIDASYDYAYGATAASPVINDSGGTTVAYHERWVTMLSGGFDMSFTRGHGVYMVDVWTGRLIWDFAQPAQGDASAAPGDPRWELRFPIAATVGMVHTGPQGMEEGSASPSYDKHFFDTASVGDLGGQLWVLRFFNPGRINRITGKVDNWFGARLYQGGRVGCASACLGQPFFGITGNVVNSTSRTYRILVGTGDRFNLLDTDGGMCGPDNIRACYLKGCTVSLAGVGQNAGNIGTYTGQSSAITGANACFPMQNSRTTSALSCATTAAGTQVVISACPNPDPTANDVDTTFTQGVTCTPENQTFSCTPYAANDEGVKLRLQNTIAGGNRFFSFLVFNVPGQGSGDVRRAVFNDYAGALRYDAARLTDASPSLVAIDGSSLPGDTPKPKYASLLDDGWYYYFTHRDSVTIGGVTYTRNPIDERVVGGAVSFAGRVFFTTLQPLPAVEATSKSPCKPNRVQYSYLYGAMVTSGMPALVDESGLFYLRPIERNSPVPPQPPVPHYFVDSEGRYQRAMLSMPPGSPPTSIGVGGPQDPTLDFGWIHVDQILHQCRHRSLEASCASY
jgi:type IV pilus assembly protein PilY1